MKVSIKDFNVDMEIKNKGVELEVRDNDGNQLGDLVITKTSLTWCPGKTTLQKGIKITWKRFIDLMDAEG